MVFVWSHKPQRPVCVFFLQCEWILPRTVTGAAGVQRILHPSILFIGIAFLMDLRPFYALWGALWKLWKLCKFLYILLGFVWNDIIKSVLSEEALGMAPISLKIGARLNSVVWRIQLSVQYLKVITFTNH